jgi:hypothetical protein
VAEFFPENGRILGEEVAEKLWKDLATVVITPQYEH